MLDLLMKALAQHQNRAISDTQVEQGRLKGYKVKTQQSSHKKKYTQFMSDVENEVIKVLAGCEQVLNEQGIELLDRFTSPPLPYSVYLLMSYRRGAVMTYRVRIGRFLMDVVILNVGMSASQSRRAKLIQSTFGSIMCADKNDRQVIKRIKLHHANTRTANKCELDRINIFKQELEGVVIEYAFNRVCSALRIGPKVYQEQGFDLVCFEDAVEFRIERCEGYVDKCVDSETFERRLKHCLRLMHSLGLAHRDIKPQNIVYSNVFKDLVFIDFGISQVVFEEVGSNTWAYKEGTQHYMSPGLRLLDPQNGGLVDLFYNDIWALNITLSNQRPRFKVPTLPENPRNENGEIENEAIKCIYKIFKSKAPETELETEPIQYAQGIFGGYFPELFGKQRSKEQIHMVPNEQFIFRIMGQSYKMLMHIQFMKADPQIRQLYDNIIASLGTLNYMPTQSTNSKHANKKYVKFLGPPQGNSKNKQENHKFLFRSFLQSANVCKLHRNQCLRLLEELTYEQRQQILSEQAVRKIARGEPQKALICLQLIQQQNEGFIGLTTLLISAYDLISQDQKPMQTKTGSPARVFIKSCLRRSERLFVLTACAVSSLWKHKQWRNIINLCSYSLSLGILSEEHESSVLVYVGCAYIQIQDEAVALPYLLQAYSTLKRNGFPYLLNLQFAIARCHVKTDLRTAVQLYRDCLNNASLLYDPNNPTYFAINLYLSMALFDVNDNIGAGTLVGSILKSVDKLQLEQEEQLLLWVRLVCKKAAIGCWPSGIDHLVQLLKSHPALTDLHQLAFETLAERTVLVMVVSICFWEYGKQDQAKVYFSKIERALTLKLTSSIPPGTASLTFGCETFTIDVQLLSLNLKQLGEQSHLYCYLWMLSLLCISSLEGSRNNQNIIAALATIPKFAGINFTYEVLLQLTNQLQKQQSYELSLQVQTLDPVTDLQYYMYKTRAHSKLRQKKEAVESLQKFEALLVLKQNVNWELSRAFFTLRIAEDYRSIGMDETAHFQFQKALHLFLKYQKEHPSHMVEHRRSVRYLMDNKLFPQACTLLAPLTSASIKEDTSWAWVKTGICYTKLKQHLRATFYLTKGIKHIPRLSKDLFDGLLYLLGIHYRNKRYRPFLRLSKKLVEEGGQKSNGNGKEFIQSLRMFIEQNKDWSKYEILFGHNRPSYYPHTINNNRDQLAALTTAKRVLKGAPINLKLLRLKAVEFKNETLKHNL